MRTLPPADLMHSLSEHEYMPLLRSLADGAARVAINMALLTELCAWWPPLDRVKDACKVKSKLRALQTLRDYGHTKKPRQRSSDRPAAPPSRLQKTKLFGIFGANCMNHESSNALSGRVMSLHLHPTEPGAALQTVEKIEVVEQKGIAGEPRYFGRVYRESGHPHKRQVTLIERKQLQQHAAARGVQAIPP